MTLLRARLCPGPAGTHARQSRCLRVSSARCAQSHSPSCTTHASSVITPMLKFMRQLSVSGAIPAVWEFLPCTGICAMAQHPLLSLAVIRYSASCLDPIKQQQEAGSQAQRTALQARHCLEGAVSCKAKLKPFLHAHGTPSRAAPCGLDHCRDGRAYLYQTFKETNVLCSYTVRGYNRGVITCRHTGGGHKRLYHPLLNFLPCWLLY